MAAKKPANTKKPVTTKSKAKATKAAKKPTPAPKKAVPAKKAAKPPVKAKAAPSRAKVKPAPKPAAKAKGKALETKVTPKAPAKTAAKAEVKPAVKAPAPKVDAKAPAKAPAKASEKTASPATPFIAKAPTTPAKGKKPAGPIVTTIRRGIVKPMPLEGEEEGLDRSLSLLAGPRNVTPYLAKKGEQYMSKTQLEHFRTILSTWKKDLMEEVDRTVTHMKDEAANPPDPNDRATLESEFSLELRTRDRERKLIRKIDEALQRIEDGSYGYCLETGEEIGIKRLEARPVATLSIEAQERRERREKQYGDRDDRYR